MNMLLNKKNVVKFILSLIVTMQLISCNQKKNEYVKVIHDPTLYTTIVHSLTYVIIYDIFTPPVASRIYACSNLAAFEVLAKEGHHFASLQGKVKGLNNIPAVYKDKKIDFPFASIMAFLKVGKQLTFSSDTMQHIIDSVKLLAKNSGMPDSLFKYSVKYGEEVGDSIISWSKGDNY